MSQPRTDLELRARYSQGGGVHRIIPAAVARPRNIVELQEALDWASARGVSITPRGAGSAMGGGSVGEGLILDLTRFGENHVDLDTAARLAGVSSAVTVAGINAAAAPAGLRFGPDPSSSGWATAGGVIGTNAAGPRSFSRGAVDRWVHELTLLTDDGPLLLGRDLEPDPAHPVVRRFIAQARPVLERHRLAVLARWPRTRKNTAGYALGRFWQSGNLLDLVIGAEGTFGVVTDAVLRLEPIPPATATLRITLLSRRDLTAAVARLGNHDAVAIELLDRTLLELIDGDPPAAVLLAEFESDDPEELELRLGNAVADLSELAFAVAIATGTAERATLWEARHAASARLAGLPGGRRSIQVIEDGCVPVERLGEYLERVEAAASHGAMTAVMFGHAGDGHVHVNLLVDPAEADWQQRVGVILDEVTGALVDLGGTVAGEHGVGRLRAPLLERLLGSEAMECFEAVRRAFDPAGRWNPGVIVPDHHGSLDRLKLGSTAAELPSDLAGRLREIESDRRWNDPRWDD